jgi:hypothetical protein
VLIQVFGDQGLAVVIRPAEGRRQVASVDKIARRRCQNEPAPDPSDPSGLLLRMGPHLAGTRHGCNHEREQDTKSARHGQRSVKLQSESSIGSIAVFTLLKPNCIDIVHNINNKKSECRLLVR